MFKCVQNAKHCKIISTKAYARIGTQNRNKLTLQKPKKPKNLYKVIQQKNTRKIFIVMPKKDSRKNYTFLWKSLCARRFCNRPPSLALTFEKLFFPALLISALKKLLHTVIDATGKKRVWHHDVTNIFFGVQGPFLFAAFRVCACVCVEISLRSGKSRNFFSTRYVKLEGREGCVQC